ncbi:MAG: hypothetical protein IT384_01210 [Deltaproteobacteria bacterium]|nr:hypothetical protein [Deltaproteobacteria bacterium]
MVEDGAHFEAAVLRALDARGAPPIAEWAAAYEEQSARFTRDRDALEGPSGLLATRAQLAVAGLVFAARTFQIARRLLAAVPPRGGLTEIGAGWGPFGAAAALLGVEPVRLIDRAPAPLALAQRLFAELGAPRPEILVAEGSTARRCGSVAIAYALNEMLVRRAPEDAVRDGAEMLRGWLSELEPGGQVYVLEPGLKSTARTLQAIRDRLAGTCEIVGPCTGRGPCPLLPRARDWCHFRWPISLGPVGQAVAQRAHRHHEEVNFSWLILRAGPAGEGEPMARVLEVRRRTRARVELTLCSDAGIQQVVALPRTPELRAVLADIQPGSVARLDPEHCELRGDGLRLRDASGIARLAPL